MGYATIQDVKARAGVLAQAWSRDSDPSDTDIERIIDEVAAELDAFIGAAGFSVPVADTTAQAALVGVNADKALLLALDATYPGGGPGVDELRTSIQGRVDKYDQTMIDKNLPAVVYLSATSAGTAEGGAADFWTVDGAQDYYWSLFGYRFGTSAWSGDAFGVMPSQAPEFRKGMRL